MEAKIRNDDVEGSVGEGHILRGLADQGAEGRDAFEVEVVLGGCGGVSAHVDVGPHVDAGGVAGAGECGDALGRSSEEKTAAATYVEDVLVSAPGVQAEHEVAVTELADLDVEEEEKSLREKKASRPEERASGE